MPRCGVVSGESRLWRAGMKHAKTDAADAQAICKAATRPTMRVVPGEVGGGETPIRAHLSEFGPPGASARLKCTTGGCWKKSSLALARGSWRWQ